MDRNSSADSCINLEYDSFNSLTSRFSSKLQLTSWSDESLMSNATPLTSFSIDDSFIVLFKFIFDSVLLCLLNTMFRDRQNSSSLDTDRIGSRGNQYLLQSSTKKKQPVSSIEIQLGRQDTTSIYESTCSYEMPLPQAKTLFDCVSAIQLDSPTQKFSMRSDFRQFKPTGSSNSSLCYYPRPN